MVVAAAFDDDSDEAQVRRSRVAQSVHPVGKGNSSEPSVVNQQDSPACIPPAMASFMSATCASPAGMLLRHCFVVVDFCFHITRLHLFL